MLVKLFDSSGLERVLESPCFLGGKGIYKKRSIVGRIIAMPHVFLNLPMNFLVGDRLDI